MVLVVIPQVVHRAMTSVKMVSESQSLTFSDGTWQHHLEGYLGPSSLHGLLANAIPSGTI